MATILWEWLNLGLRWLHVIAGIAWIGSSFYFVHLDSSLRRRDGLPDGAGGEAWQVHGGGFYHMVEISGGAGAHARSAHLVQMGGVRHLDQRLLPAGRRSTMSAPGSTWSIRSPTRTAKWMAIAASIALLIVGWVMYDELCKSRLGRNETTLCAIGFAFLVALAWLSTELFSGRGAYMQMGALIGTIMVANVFLIIIPNQKVVVADLIAGREPDPELGEQAKQRSLHNNYLTLPVLFLMISNHYPMTFASRWNWLIFALVLIVGAVIRHFYNTRHKGLPSPWWTWGVAAAGCAAIVLLSTGGPSHAERAAIAPAEPVSFADVEAIVQSRCSMCHAAEPLWPGIERPPKGVMLDTAEMIRLHGRQIYLQAVASDAMPPANVTDIEPEERGVLAAWYEAGEPAE